MNEEIKPDRVSFKQVFPTGIQYLPLHIGAEYPVLPGQDPNEVFKAAVDQIRKWNLEYNPSMGMALEMNGVAANDNSYVPPKEKPSGTIEAFINDINSCTAVDQKNAIGVQVGLLAYEHLTGTSRIKEAYEIKLKELSI